MSEWQPIETAPKDRYILLFSPDEPDWAGNMAVGKWFGEGPVHGEPTAEVDCFWTLGGPNGGLELDSYKWTHWMPLPDPPEQPKKNLDPDPPLDETAW